MKGESSSPWSQVILATLILVVLSVFVDCDIEYNGGITTGPILFSPSNGTIIVSGFNTIAFLTIEAGTVIKMKANAYIKVEGTFSAIGTAENPILFTSYSSTPNAGDWGYIHASGNTEMHFVTMEYGGASNRIFYMSGNFITVMNSVFRNTLGGIYDSAGTCMYCYLFSLF
jgi:hypothetical protein